MILSIVLGLAIPTQLYVVNNFPFENPGLVIATDYFFIAPAYVVYLGWYGIRGLVLDALPAPFVWSVLGPGTLSAIQTLVGLPIAISVWRTGTGHGRKELIEATTLLNLMVLLLMTIDSLKILLMDGTIWVLFVPLFPGMAVVGCYYLSKSTRAEFGLRSV